MKAGDIVLVDTNVILEAHRVSRWHHLSSNFEIHTVSKVLEETQTGYSNRDSAGEIDYVTLKNSIHHVYDVTESDLVEFGMLFPQILNLDDGERDLLIYAKKMDKDCWLLSSPDKAAMRVAHTFGWIERLVSLECLLGAINTAAQIPLRDNYTEAWNSKTKMMIKFNLL